MICERVLEGFLDEYDFAVVRVRDVTCEPRVEACVWGNPIPVVVVREGVAALLAEHDVVVSSEGELLWLIATPAFAVVADVVLIDEDENEWWTQMGERRVGRLDTPPLDADLLLAFHDVTARTLGEDESRVWDSGVYPAGDSIVVRYRVVLAAGSASEAARLERERLTIAMLDPYGRRGHREVAILEDSMVEIEGDRLARELTVAAIVPADAGTGCLWVWSRVLGRGVFRGMADWMLRPRLSWFAMVSASPETDPGYDAWARERGFAEALSQEREIEALVGTAEEGDAEAARELADGSDLEGALVSAEADAADPELAAGAAEDAELALPHLTVVIAEDPEAELGHGPTRLADIEAAPGPLSFLKPAPVNTALIRTISSLSEQSFQDFDVVWAPAERPLGAAGLENGTWRVIVGCGDVLEPGALERIACAAATGGTRLVYGDEDVCSLESGSPVLCGARLKPRFSVEELYWGNGLGLPLAISPEVAASDARSAYELALAALEQGGVEGVTQLEGVLSHAPRRRPFAQAASVDALARHLERRGIAADVAYVETNIDDDPEREPGGFLRVRYDRPEPCPLVSIIIPNRNHADYLRPCVESILEETVWPAFEVVIVENGSTDADILALYAELQEADPRVRVVSWTGREFNYSAVVNRGASKARGTYLCLLNNDTKVLDGEWLDELVGPLLREEVGVTGALLTFSDGLVQHAGMVAVPSGGFGHMQQNLWPGAVGSSPAEGDDGYLMTLKRPVAYPMVTGACQVMSKALFDELGGYDETLAVGFNDGDFCLRARALGKETLFVPYARLWHREFGTRQRESDSAAERERSARELAIMGKRYPGLFERDPFLNGALDPDNRYFRLDRPYEEMEL